MTDTTTEIAINQICVDGGTQTRAALDARTIAEYASALEAGATFPPVIVFFDGAVRWLADGFHRVEAHRRCNLATIRAEVRQGTQRDALLYSAGANAEHGLRRSAADKRRAVETLLADEGWSQWSTREIARCAGVPESLVRALRARSGDDAPSIPGACGIEVGDAGYPAGWIVLIVESVEHPGYFWIQAVNLGAPISEEAFGETTKPVRADFVRTVLEHLGVPIDRLTWIDTAPPDVLQMGRDLAGPEPRRDGAFS